MKFLVIFVFLFYTCGTTTMSSLSKEEKEAIQTATFKGSYINVFIAVVEVFHDAGYHVEHADETLGLITTDWKEEKTGIFFRESIRKKINVALEIVDENSTKVKLSCLAQTKTDNGWSGTEDEMRLYAAKKFYKKYFKLIQTKLKKYIWIK